MGIRRLYVVERTRPRFHKPGDRGESEGGRTLNLLKGMYVIEFGVL